MSVNLYKEYDDILDLRKLMIQYAEDNFELLRNAVKNNTATIQYGRNAYCLGHFCPSLVLDKISQGFKKEKLLKSIPKTKKGYVIYELDANEKLLRIQSVNSFGTIFEQYIIRQGNSEFGVNLLNGKDSTVDSTRIIYDGDKVVRFDIIGSRGIWSELYSYDDNNIRKIKCKQYHYVQGLSGTSNSIPVGQEGSPMKLIEMEIELDDDNNVIKIEGGYFINGKTELECVYMK